MKTLIILAFLLSSTIFAQSDNGRTLASIRQNLRVEHARELMGPRYKKSIISKFETKNLENHIYAIAYKRLPRLYKNRAHKVAETIINEAHRHSLDPYFVLAVISGESSFNPLAKGPVGELGLMQIRLSTGKWMAELYKADWQGEKTLLDPVKNIKLGVAYLGWLRNKFEGHGQLYLAAYNMGPGSVKKALSKRIYPKDYPIHVMKRYIAFYKEIGSLKQSL